MNPTGIFGQPTARGVRTRSRARLEIRPALRGIAAKRAADHSVRAVVVGGALQLADSEHAQRRSAFDGRALQVRRIAHWSAHRAVEADGIGGWAVAVLDATSVGPEPVATRRRCHRGSRACGRRGCGSAAVAGFRGRGLALGRRCAARVRPGRGRSGVSISGCTPPVQDKGRGQEKERRRPGTHPRSLPEIGCLVLDSSDRALEISKGHGVMSWGRRHPDACAKVLDTAEAGPLLHDVGAQLVPFCRLAKRGTEPMQVIGGVHTGFVDAARALD